jgi:hypothetical protein
MALHRVGMIDRMAVPELRESNADGLNPVPRISIGAAQARFTGSRATFSQ